MLQNSNCRMVKEASSFQFGITVFEPHRQPTLTIHRFRIYEEGKNQLLEPRRQARNLNYLVCGTPDEFMNIRIYMAENGLLQEVRSYFLPTFDSETADYLTKALLSILKQQYPYSLSLHYKLFSLCRKRKR